MKTFNSFKVLNKALGEVSSDAFRVLYYICNNLKINKTIRTDIDRIDIVLRLKLWDEDNGTTRQLKSRLDDITKCTNELEQKNFLVKDVIYDKTTGKRKTFYAIPERFLETETTSDSQNTEAKRQKTWVTKKDQKKQSSKVGKVCKADKVENEEMEHQFSVAVPNYEEEDNLPF